MLTREHATPKEVATSPWSVLLAVCASVSPRISDRLLPIPGEESPAEKPDSLIWVQQNGSGLDTAVSSDLADNCYLHTGLKVCRRNFGKSSYAGV